MSGSKDRTRAGRSLTFALHFEEALERGLSRGDAVVESVLTMSPALHLTDLAERIGERRSDLSMCLHRKYGRRYERIRRKVEGDCRLLRGTLDAAIDGEEQ